MIDFKKFFKNKKFFKKLFKLRTIVLGLVFLAAVLCGGIVGTYFAVKKTLPDISILEDVRAGHLDRDLRR